MKHDNVSSFFINRCLLWLLSRLRAGRDQAYHLTRRTQDRRLGRGQHSHRVERRAWGPGVPTQERTDPQVRRLMALHSGTNAAAGLPIITKHRGFIRVHLEGLWSRNIHDSAPNFLLSVSSPSLLKAVKLILCPPLWLHGTLCFYSDVQLCLCWHFPVRPVIQIQFIIELSFCFSVISSRISSVLVKNISSISGNLCKLIPALSAWFIANFNAQNWLVFSIRVDGWLYQGNGIFRQPLSLTKGQGCHWALYRDEAVYFPNGTVTSLPEEEAVMMCLCHWSMVMNE